jgi:hypothetical protein
MKDFTKGSAPRDNSINYISIGQLYHKYLSLLTRIYTDLALTWNHLELWKKARCIVTVNIAKNDMITLYQTDSYPYSYIEDQFWKVS